MPIDLNNVWTCIYVHSVWSVCFKVCLEKKKWKEEGVISSSITHRLSWLANLKFEGKKVLKTFKPGSNGKAEYLEGFLFISYSMQSISVSLQVHKVIVNVNFFQHVDHKETVMFLLNLRYCWTWVSGVLFSFFHSDSDTCICALYLSMEEDVCML